MSPGMNRALVSALRPKINVADLPDITEFEEKFVNAYLMNPEPINAYRMARGTAKVATSVAKAEAMRYLRMPHVQAWVRALRHERAMRTQVTQDRVLREISVNAFSNVANYTIDEEGFITLREGVPQEAMKAIAFMERTVTTNEDGNKVVTTKLKLWNKNEALNLAGKHLGMFIDRKLNVSMSLEQMMTAIAKGDTPDMQQIIVADTGEDNSDLPEETELTPSEPRDGLDIDNPNA